MYTLKRGNTETIVNVLSAMLDGGPAPKVNFRPAQKRKNAADQFYYDNQQMYECRGRNSQDRVGAVNRHNNAFPKMYDELQKRESIANVRTSNHRHQSSNYRKCQRHTSRKTRNNQKRTRLPTRRPISRISKKKRTIKRSRKCHLSHKSCQCCPVIPVTECKSSCTETSPILNSDQRLFGENKMADENSEDTKEDNGKRIMSESDIGSSKNPDTDMSVSSYSSGLSINHEPMVS